MNISKLTILPHSTALHKVTLNKPSNEILNNELLKAANSHVSLPQKLVKKVMKERSIPSYVNPQCYKDKNFAGVEDARVLGAKTIEFFG